MKNNTHKLNKISGNKLDKSKVFIELNSIAWRSPNKISLDELIKEIKIKEQDISKNIDKKTIVLDPHTLKIKVDDSLINTSNVHHESLKKDIVHIHKPPKDASTVSGLHLMSDSNYLYVWIGERWKRISLSEW